MAESGFKKVTKEPVMKTAAQVSSGGRINRVKVEAPTIVDKKDVKHDNKLTQSAKLKKNDVSLSSSSC